MLKRSATLVEMLVLVCPAVSLAVDNAKPISNFVGTWKADSKRNVGSYPQLRFRRATDGGLEELRGFEAQPLVHPVKFGTQPYAVDDGTATIAWKEIDTTHFERQLFEHGKLISTRKIEIAPDGKQLTEMFAQRSPDGKDTVRTTVYRRASGGPTGLEGNWKPESVRDSRPSLQRIELVGNSSLRVIRPNGTVIWNFDGKPSPVTGEGVIPGITETAKLIDSNRIEVTVYSKGVLSGTRTVVLTPDGKRMTVTLSGFSTAGSAPTVFVYHKQ